MSLILPGHIISLTPSQSIGIHGLFKPHRYLSWEHIANDPSITLDKLLRAGVSTNDLHYLQRDVKEWVRYGKVGFADVGKMTIWPLHPIQHLGGSLMNLMEQQYPAPLLLKLGITHATLFRELGMRPEHMPMLKLTLDEWKLIGMPKAAMKDIPGDLVIKMFNRSKDVLLFEWVKD